MFSASAMPRILQRAPSSLFFQFCAQCVCNILKVIGDVFLGEKIVFLHAVSNIIIFAMFASLLDIFS